MRGASDLRIGFTGAGSSVTVDDILIYGRALTAAEVVGLAKNATRGARSSAEALGCGPDGYAYSGSPGCSFCVGGNLTRLSDSGSCQPSSSLGPRDGLVFYLSGSASEGIGALTGLPIPTGRAQYVTDRFGIAGGAVELSPAGSFITPGIPAGLPVNFAARTVAAWVKCDPLACDGKSHQLYGHGWPTSNAQAYGLGFQFLLDGNAACGGLSVVVVQSSSFTYSAPPPAGSGPICDRTWHHVAMSMTTSGDYVRHYVDGKMTAEIRPQGNYHGFGVASRVTISASGGGGLALADYRVYSRALSAAEVAWLGTGVGPSPTPTPSATPSGTATASATATSTASPQPPSYTPTMTPSNTATASATMSVGASPSPPPCPAGKLCQAVTIRSSSVRVVVDCPSGRFCAGGNDPLTGSSGPCDAGFFCPPNSVSRVGAPNGGRCAAGFFCPQGSQNSTGYPDGGLCPAGHWCAEGTGTPVVGGAGYFYPPGSTIQQGGGLAPLGHYAGFAAEEALPCAPGSYAPRKGMYQCTLCPLGRFGRTPAATSLDGCERCPLPGFTTMSPGATSPSACVPERACNDYEQPGPLLSPTSPTTCLPLICEGGLIVAGTRRHCTGCSAGTVGVPPRCVSPQASSSSLLSSVGAQPLLLLPGFTRHALPSSWVLEEALTNGSLASLRSAASAIASLAASTAVAATAGPSAAPRALADAASSCQLPDGLSSAPGAGARRSVLSAGDDGASSTSGGLVALGGGNNSMAMSLSLAIILVVVASVSLNVIVLLLCSLPSFGSKSAGCLDRLKARLRSVDAFSLLHAVEEGASAVKRSTALGGGCSMLGALAVINLAAVLILQREANNSVTSTTVVGADKNLLEDTVLLTRQAGNSNNGTVRIDVLAAGDGAGACNSVLALSSTGLLAGGNFTSAAPAACGDGGLVTQHSFYCRGCVFGASAALRFRLPWSCQSLALRFEAVAADGSSNAFTVASPPVSSAEQAGLLKFLSVDVPMMLTLQTDALSSPAVRTRDYVLLTPTVTTLQADASPLLQPASAEVTLTLSFSTAQLAQHVTISERVTRMQLLASIVGIASVFTAAGYAFSLTEAAAGMRRRRQPSRTLAVPTTSTTSSSDGRRNTRIGSVSEHLPAKENTAPLGGRNSLLQSQDNPLMLQQPNAKLSHALNGLTRYDSRRAFAPSMPKDHQRLASLPAFKS